MLAAVLALLAASGPAAPPASGTVSPLAIPGSAAKPPPADVSVELRASDDDINQPGIVWPSTAYNMGFDGHVSLRCLIDIHGLAERCEVAYEAPLGRGYGKAALLMRPTFKVAPTMGPDGPIAAEKVIDLTFRRPERLGSGADAHHAMATYDFSQLLFDKGNGRVMKKVSILDFPSWVQAANFDDLASAYPTEGGGVEGYAVDHCKVRRDGGLMNCASTKEAPEGHGFAKAALGLASRFRVAPQVAQASHRDELYVDVPIRFPAAREMAERTVTAPT